MTGRNGQDGIEKGILIFLEPIRMENFEKKELSDAKKNRVIKGNWRNNSLHNFEQNTNILLSSLIPEVENKKRLANNNKWSEHLVNREANGQYK